MLYIDLLLIANNQCNNFVWEEGPLNLFYKQKILKDNHNQYLTINNYKEVYTC